MERRDINKISDAEQILLYLESIAVLSDDAAHAANAGEAYEVLCKKIVIVNKNIKEFKILAQNKRVVLAQAFEAASNIQDSSFAVYGH